MREDRGGRIWVLICIVGDLLRISRRWGGVTGQVWARQLMFLARWLMLNLEDNAGGAAECAGSDGSSPERKWLPKPGLLCSGPTKSLDIGENRYDSKLAALSRGQCWGLESQKITRTVVVASRCPTSELGARGGKKGRGGFLHSCWGHPWQRRLNTATPRVREP